MLSDEQVKAIRERCEGESLPRAIIDMESDRMELLADREELLKRIAELEDRADKVARAMADNAHISFDGPDGIVLHDNLAVRALAYSYDKAFRDHDAINYLEQTVTTEDGVAYLVTIQRKDKPTPHELRKQAEARIAELEAALKPFADYAERFHDRKPDATIGIFFPPSPTVSDLRHAAEVLRKGKT